MTEEEDWLMLPVKRGMCKYESLVDGTLDLVDIARMNECLEVEEENIRRLTEK
jgi:hypothetical protein